jgi:protein-S-isoprenylcysteine O-methyltransferase Ste14
MRLAVLIIALAILVLVWRSRRGVEVWHVAVDQSAGRIQGP